MTLAGTIGKTPARTWRRGGVPVGLLVVAALVLAACSNSPSSPAGAASSPTVASLANGSGSGHAGGTGDAGGTGHGGGSSTTTLPAPKSGSPTALVDEWAQCERAHGDPNQADPTISADGVINVSIPRGAEAAGDLHQLTGTCSQYMAAAQHELEAANPVAPPPSQSEYLKYVACMRANGVPKYPYPSGPDGDQTDFIGSGVDPNSPLVERVNDLCGKQIGAPAWWINGTDTPGSVEVGTAGETPPNPPACVFQTNPCPTTRNVPGTPSNG